MGNGADQDGERDARGARVLVVESDRLAAAALTSLLRTDGHDVVVEYAARAAVRSVVRYRPDVVVVDVDLPAGDGFDLVERLLIVPTIAEHDVVVLVGDDAEAADAVRALGAEHVLEGAVVPSELRATVARAVDAIPARHIVPERAAALAMLSQLGAVASQGELAATE